MASIALDNKERVSLAPLCWEFEVVSTGLHQRQAALWRLHYDIENELSGEMLKECERKNQDWTLF